MEKSKDMDGVEKQAEELGQRVKKDHEFFWNGMDRDRGEHNLYSVMGIKGRVGAIIKL